VSSWADNAPLLAKDPRGTTVHRDIGQAGADLVRRKMAERSRCAGVDGLSSPRFYGAVSVTAR
jgi:hypothetical protein